MTTPTDITDAESRERILHDLDSNFLVEAAAGTGKTTCIIGRMVNLVATGKCEIDRLAAMTFTRKAAAELRERFQVEMRREESSEHRSEKQRARLRRALNRIEQAFVGTYHSFCSLLLRERPIEAGVDPGFRELEEDENGHLIDDAWNTFLDQLHDTDDDCLVRLRDYGLRTSDLKSCFDKFVHFPDVDQWPHESPDQIDVESLKDALRQYVAHIESIADSFPKDRGSDGLMDRYERALRKSQHIHWDRLGDVFDLAEICSSKHDCTLKYWNDTKTAKRERDRYDAFRSGTIKPALQWWYSYRFQFLIDLMKRARDIFDTTRRESAGLNFEDLLVKTANALKDQPDLRTYFQRRFSHLLVDEFQDTDPIQAEILAFLTSADHSQQHWQQCHPRSGSLFLVGDPKQSIFRFRRADIVTYAQMKSLFRQSGGAVVPLLRNFRSVSELREWNNDTYDQLFGTQESIFSPAAEAMLQGRIDAIDGQLRGVNVLTVPGQLAKDDAIAYEADKIASYIRAAIDGGSTVPRSKDELDSESGAAAKPDDFLIIAWKKEDLQHYAAALDRLDIPNEVSGSNAFVAIEELRVLTNCLQVVDDASNPIPYVALLRGGVFGFSDLDLYNYKQAGGRFSYRSLPERLEPELKSRFERLHLRLQTYIVWLRGLPFAAAAERIAADLGLMARAAASRDGDVTSGGFLKAIEWIRAHSWDFDSARDMIGYLEDLSENVESDPVTAMPPGESVVRVMNLHKVKGLEAPVVFLAGVFGSWNNRPNFHIDRSTGTTNGYLAITKRHGQHQTRPIAQSGRWDEVAAAETRFDEAEKRRLLYVATTRAKTQLIVSRRDCNKNKTSRWQELDPFLVGASELSVLEVSSAAKQVKAAAHWTETDLVQQWQRLQAPSYAVVAAKHLSLKGKTRPDWQASGDYGHGWGSAIHDLLEAKMRHPDVDSRRRAELLAAEYQIPHDRVSEMMSTVESVLASDIWKRAQSASRCYVELPFDLPASFDDKPAVVRGVIDLMFEEPSGWVIVDYKTDDITTRQVAEAVEYYRGQLDTYAGAWRTATGMSVAEKGLFFTRVNLYHRI